MATRKAAVDPLIEELPPEQESKPVSAADVKFDVEISSYVAGGRRYFRWTILDHNGKGYVGDYSSHSSVLPDGRTLNSSDEAEDDAREYIRRIRETIELKLNAPDAYRVTL